MPILLTRRDAGGGRKIVSYNSTRDWNSLSRGSGGRRCSELKACRQSRDDVAFATAADRWHCFGRVGRTEEIRDPCVVWTNYR